MMQKLRIALGALFAILLLSFIIQNRFDVTFRYWPFINISAPLWLIVVGSAGFGVLAFHFFQAFRKSKKKE
jgi:uncharacterized integral membrane protein